MRITLERPASEKNCGRLEKSAHIDNMYTPHYTQATIASIPIYKNAIRRRRRTEERGRWGAGENLKTILDGQDDEQRTNGATHDIADIAKSIRLYF